jgi:hypothetical protein
MDALQAHEIFGAMKERVCLPIDIQLHGVDAWPAAATAAADLAGYLDDALGESDLVEGVKHFVSLSHAGIFSENQWFEETTKVVARLIEWGDLQGIPWR